MRIELQRIGAAPTWFNAWVTSAERAINVALNAMSPRALPRYAIADLPDASLHEGSQVWIISTKRPAYSDGAVWRYSTTETV